MEYYAIVPSDLKHHGVLGQKWGVRRYQNEDGSLNAKGQKHYGKKYEKLSKKASREAYKKYNSKHMSEAYNSAINAANNSPSFAKKLYSTTSSRSSDTASLNKELSKHLSAYQKQETLICLQSNKNYQKAIALSNKYNLDKYNEMAKSNKNTVIRTKSQINDYNKNRTTKSFQKYLNDTTNPHLTDSIYDDVHSIDQFAKTYKKDTGKNAFK